MPRLRFSLFVLLAFAVTIARAAPAAAQWPLDGIPFLAGYNANLTPIVVSDGGTGSIAVYLDLTTPGSAYAQHLDAGGNALWPGKGARLGFTPATIAIPDGQGGVISANATNAQRVDASGNILWGSSGVSGGGNALTSDGAGGAILAYATTPSPSDIFARRISSSGSVLWNVSACTVAGDQLSPSMCSDGAGGAVVFWVDRRAGPDDLYAQRINASGTTVWPLNGISVASAAAEQNAAFPIPDGATGTFVTWVDRRGGTYDIYQQHLDSGGGSLWGPNGAVLCAAAADQGRPQIVGDGAGGFIAGWVDSRFHGSGISYGDYYAQRVNAAGVPQWAPNGVPIATNGLVQGESVVTDGAGGAIVAWTDSRNGFTEQDIYAQRINASGAMQWDTAGVLVCGLQEAQSFPKAAPNGAGGVVIAWRDNRNSSPIRGTRNDMYVQAVFGNGTIGWTPNVRATLGGVTDVPADEGGAVQLALTAAPFDVLSLEPRVTGYNVWRRVTPPSSGSAPPLDARRALRQASEALPGTILGPEVAAAVGFPPGSWQSVAYTAAAHQSAYALIAATRSDSGAEGPAREAYVVTVHTDIPDLITLAGPDSGSSVDNLPPGIPSPLSGMRTGPSNVHLVWSPSRPADWWHYAVYRGASPSFVPSAGNRVGQPTSAAWDDDGYVEGVTHYKVTSIDRHGNESAAALLAPSEITAIDPRPVPAVSYLALAGANPVHERAVIEYGLSRAGHVRLSIYDVRGRWVCDLVNGSEAAGVRRVEWVGTDRDARRVPAGIYFVRFQGPEIVRTLRVVRRS